MNFGTKLRTVARIVASLNTAVYAVSASVAGLGFSKLTLLWTILTIIVDFAVAFVTTYYNNDYTDIASEYTGEMRQKKAELKDDYIGEKFHDSVGEGELDDDESNL